MPGAAAAPQQRGLLWLGFVYLVSVLAAIALIDVVTFTTPRFRHYPALALFALVTVPLWLYMLGGIWRRLHGDPRARIVPRILFRILNLVFGAQALVTGALGLYDLVRFSTSGKQAVYLAPAVVAFGALMLYRALRR